MVKKKSLAKASEKASSPSVGGNVGAAPSGLDPVGVDAFNFERLCASGVLPILLRSCAVEEFSNPKTSATSFRAVKKPRSIIWATDSYSHLGDVGLFGVWNEVTEQAVRILFKEGLLTSRAQKARDVQRKRSRDRAEVFTPTRICAFMCDFLDQDWFGLDSAGEEAGVFTRPTSGGWERVDDLPPFRRKADWQAYVKSRRLEITCGEAPFITSRYDAATGEFILIANRVGALDRKLRVVRENVVNDPDQWLKWATRAVENVYGYEYQGDSLFLARWNVLATFVENMDDAFPDLDDDLKNDAIRNVANIVAWNFWQMDGLTGLRPCEQDERPPDLFASARENDAWICTWLKSPKYLSFKSLSGENEQNMKFDYIIGNPPYQEEVEGNKQMRPVYQEFMDAAYQVGRKVMLITPGRFLIPNDDSRNKWNQKYLSDPHLKVILYEPNSEKFFSDVQIKGGVAISFRNEEQNYGLIEHFFVFKELKTIYEKVVKRDDFISIGDYVYGYNKFDLETLYRENPEIYDEIPANIRDRREVGASAFTKVPVFDDSAGGGGVLQIYRLNSE